MSDVFRQKTTEEVLADLEEGMRSSGLPEHLIGATLESLRRGHNSRTASAPHDQTISANMSISAGSSGGATRMRSAEAVAQEMAEGLRRRFGHDMRHPAGKAWIAACIMEARHEMALELGLSDAPRPAPTDPWRLNRDG